ncbi:GerAB/ArcD/ProY family transporter [Bacillaceae bacterium W0354]
MEKHKEKIGVREISGITVLIIGTKLQDDTPAILYVDLLNAAWMAPIIMTVISAIPIFLLLKVTKKYDGKSLMDIIIHLLGKPIGILTLFILWLISASALIVDTSIYTDIINTMYFMKTPAIITYAVLMAVCAYGAKKGLVQIGSVTWAMLPYIKISLLLALILTLVRGNFSFLTPVFGPGEWEVIKESALKTSIFADFLYIFFLIPFVRNTEKFGKGMWISLVYLTFQLTVGFAAFVLLFDYSSVVMLNYPFHETIRYLQLGFLTNIETFFFQFWLIGALIRFTVYIYVNALLFGRIFNIKSFEYVIPALATLFLFIGLIPETPTFSIFNLRQSLLVIVTPIFLFLPCLLWVMTKFKGDFKDEKSPS